MLMYFSLLVAVFILYFKNIWNMIRHPFTSDLKWLIVATVPTVIYALALKFFGIEDALDGAARAILPWAFFATSIFLFLADKFAEYHAAGKTTHKRIKLRDALAMGLMQCIGTFAGVSRSGSTITGGLATGLSRKRVADFSFMMSIPAILGALLLDTLDLIESGAMTNMSIDILPVLAGVVAAMLSGIAAIKFMLFMIKKIHLKWFAAYTGLLGAIILISDFLIP